MACITEAAIGFPNASGTIPPENGTLPEIHYVYNFVGATEQKIVGNTDIPTGENVILSASFDKDGEDPPGISTGILSLWHGDTKVGESRIKTQPGKFMHRR